VIRIKKPEWKKQRPDI